jgi:hypothetical protein
MNFLLTGLENPDDDVCLADGIIVLIKRMGGTVVDSPTAMKLKDTLHSGNFWHSSVLFYYLLAENYSCVLISTGPKRTMKYITALACRMACVSYRFILDCFRSVWIQTSIFVIYVVESILLYLKLPAALWNINGWETYRPREGTKNFTPFNMY